MLQLNYFLLLSTFVIVNSVFVFFDQLDQLFDTVESLHIVNFSILLGDFNINLCNKINNPLYPPLSNLYNSFFLAHVVNEPTHVTSLGCRSLIDLVFLSHPL